MSTILGWVAIIIVPAIAIIGYDIYKLFKTLKNNDRGEKKKKNDKKIEKSKKLVSGPQKKEGRFKK